MKKNICLASLCASHYRKMIYQLLEQEFECDFIFGKYNTSVKQLKAGLFHHAYFLPNIHYKYGEIYRIKGAVEKTKNYSIVINDMGIMCVSSWHLAIMAKLRGQKVFIWDHGWYGRESILKKWIKRVYFGLADGSFIYGNYARELMAQNGFNKEKLHVIYNSLDYDSQYKLRESLRPSSIYRNHFCNNNPVIIMIGRLNSRKKLDLLLEAVALLKLNGEKYNVVLIGSGEEREKLEGISVERDISDQVWFYGECYEEETNAELIFNADLCAVPGDIGLTAMHSMMFGCPVITHDYFPNHGPEFEAIHPGVTGDFYTHNSVDSLADKISAWLNGKVDQRDSVAMACYQEIDEKWNPHVQIEIIKSVIGC